MTSPKVTREPEMSIPSSTARSRNLSLSFASVFVFALKQRLRRFPRASKPILTVPIHRSRAPSQ
jgi:hypothetical protein